MRRGHYQRTVTQMEVCLEYIAYCNERQPGAVTLTDPLFPLHPDSSRFVHNIQAQVGGVDNIAPLASTLAEFWKMKRGQ
jgi:hypothetical protein